jgi:ABC-type sugar transport system ATPase subunit
MLEIKEISIRFGNFALEDISLEIAPGDYLALLGVSGAGKTVLLEVLAGLVKPAKGQIRWNGRTAPARAYSSAL